MEEDWILEWNLLAEARLHVQMLAAQQARAYAMQETVI